MKRLVLFAAVFVAACAQPPQLTREQQLAATTRLYPGVDKERLIEGAKRVLRLADGGFDRVQFLDRPDGVVAVHKTLLFLLVASNVRTDTWTLTVVETPAGLQAQVTLGRQNQGSAIAPTTMPGVYAPTGSTTAGEPIGGTAVFELFWRRLDYMVHRTDEWATCRESDDRVSRGELVGPNDALCSHLLPDHRPGEDLSLRAPANPAMPPTGHQVTGRAIDRAPR